MTSRLPNVRIDTLWKLTLDDEFLQCASVLKSAASSKDDVIKHGLRALAMVYGSRNGETLEDLRINMFQEKSNIHTEFQDIQNYSELSSNIWFWVFSYSTCLSSGRVVDGNRLGSSTLWLSYERWSNVAYNDPVLWYLPNSNSSENEMWMQNRMFKKMFLSKSWHRVFFQL